VLSGFYLDSRRNPNSTSRVLQVISLAEDGVLHIDKHKDETIDKAFVNDHYYPLQPPLPSFIVYPFYKILKAIGICKDYEDDNGNSVFLLASFLIGSLPFALIIIWLFSHLVIEGRTAIDAVLISMLPLYGSLFFVYSGMFYSHVLVAMTIIYSYHFIQKQKHLFLAGVLSGVAFFSEYLTAVIFAVWFFQIVLKKEYKQGIYYALGLLPFVLAFLTYNYLTTGNILHTVYSYNFAYDMDNVGFSYPNIVSLFQMLFSPWRGAFIYMPVLIASVLAFNWKWEGIRNFISNPVIVPALTLTLALSAYSEWHGGWTFGPRYLMPAMILIFVGNVHKIELKGVKKYLFWIPVLLGLTYTFIAKVTVLRDIPSKFKYPFYQFVWPNFMSGNFNEGQVLTYLFDIPYSVAAAVFVLAFTASIIWFSFALSRKAAKTVNVLSD